MGVDHRWSSAPGPPTTRARTGSGSASPASAPASARRPASTPWSSGATTGCTLAWFDGRRWDFDAAGRLERTWAGPGTAVAFRHDEGGRLLELTHERGRRSHDRLAPGGSSRIVAVTGSDGRRVDYRYDDTGQLIEAAGPAGARHYGIDPTGRVESVTDADGVVELVNTYDDDGRVLTQRSPFGRAVTFGYEPDGATVVADDSAGPRNTYRHDAAGRLLAATDGHGHTQHKRYDAAGNPIEIVERGGAVTRQEFDHRAHLVRRDLPSGAVYEITWDELDRVTSITTHRPADARGHDPLRATPAVSGSRRRSPTRKAGSPGSRWPTGWCPRSPTPTGSPLRLRHDADGHLVEARDAAGGVARIERDAGRPAHRGDHPGRAAHRADATTRAACWCSGATRPARSGATSTPPPAGPTATVDPTGARTETRYGPHGEAVELVDALGAVTTRRYDNFGNLAGVTAPDGAKWSLHPRRAVPADRLDRPGRRHLAARARRRGQHHRGPRPHRHPHRLHLRRVPAGSPASTTAWSSTASATTSWAGPPQHRRADGRTRRAEYDRCGRRTTVADAAGGHHPLRLHPGRAAGPHRHPRRPRGALRLRQLRPADHPHRRQRAAVAAALRPRRPAGREDHTRPGWSRRSPATRPAGSPATASPAAAPPATATTPPAGSSRSPTAPAAASSPTTPPAGSSPPPTRSATPPATPGTSAAT